MPCAAASDAARWDPSLRDTEPLTLRAALGLLSVLLVVTRGALACLLIRAAALSIVGSSVAGCGAAPPAGGVGLSERARV